MQIKLGKNPRVIFDASTKGHPHEVVLNDMTSTEIEANITFGWAKLKLLLRIYNLRVSYPNCKIYLALANIAACFCFPRVHVDLTGTLDLWLRKCISWKPAWSSVPPLQLVAGNLFDEQSKDRSSSTPRDLT